MAAVTLYPNYIRKLAESYRLLRKGEYADPKVLEQILKASDRCIAAHMRAELVLASDVKLPLATVLMMLQYVRMSAAERLEPVPVPDDFQQPVSPELRPFLLRAFDRFRDAVAA